MVRPSGQLSPQATPGRMASRRRQAGCKLKPPWFDYHAPESLEAALELLDNAGYDGRVLAGGQSLMPMLNMRIVNPSVLVDINRIEGLDTLEAGPDQLRVGALVRHADLLRDPAIREGWPLLAEATTQVAHPTIRNRGTVCGSVSHNDPAAEHPGILVTHGGSVVIASTKGQRKVPAEAFFDGMMSTTLDPGEMVIELRYPRPPRGAGHGFVEFARRLGDFAIAGAAVLLTVENGVCETARLTIIGMGDGPLRARAAEELMAGSALTQQNSGEIFTAAAQDVMAALDPADDVHASASYRRHLAGVMTQRALEAALARVGDQ